MKIATTLLLVFALGISIKVAAQMEDGAGSANANKPTTALPEPNITTPPLDGGITQANGNPGLTGTGEQCPACKANLASGAYTIAPDALIKPNSTQSDGGNTGRSSQPTIK